jgi:hypothetical protein
MFVRVVSFGGGKIVLEMNISAVTDGNGIRG